MKPTPGDLPDPEVTIVQARARLADLVTEARRGRVTYVTRHGQRVAAIVPADLATAIERVRDAARAATLEALREVAEDLAAVEAIRAAQAQGAEPVTLQELRHELGL